MFGDKIKAASSVERITDVYMSWNMKEIMVLLIF